MLPAGMPSARTGGRCTRSWVGARGRGLPSAGVGRGNDNFHTMLIITIFGHLHLISFEVLCWPWGDDGSTGLPLGSAWSGWDLGKAGKIIALDLGKLQEILENHIFGICDGNIKSEMWKFTPETGTPQLTKIHVKAAPLSAPMAGGRRFFGPCRAENFRVETCRSI